ncbi:flagellar basal body rod protein FlgB [Acidisoma sp. 7E03]
MQVSFIDFYGGVLDAGQQRATLVANNIANADTPGFKARDIDFTAALAGMLDGSLTSASAVDPLYRQASTVTLDGNDVSLDGERIEAAQNAERMTGAAIFLHQSTADLIGALRPNPGGV